MRKIKVKHVRSKEVYEFVCFSTKWKEHIVYRTKSLEQFDIGHIKDFQPVGMSWEKVKQHESQL